MCCSLLNKIYELWMQFRYHFDARVKTAKKKSLNYASACRGTRLACWYNLDTALTREKKLQKRRASTTRLRVEALDCDGCSKKNSS